MLTEQRNALSQNLHNKTTLDILKIMNAEDKTVTTAVENELQQIKEAVDLMVYALQNNSSIIYIGAGTSGRLGVLDASECPPTFGVDPNVFKGIIAGGDHALRNAIEDAEDNINQGKIDLERSVSSGDVVIGLTTSGNTPYVLGAIEKAKELGLKTIGISCNKNTKLSKLVDVPIELIVGPEVLTGSTRLKAGTAQKLTLNMLSTATMVKTGKVYDNLMVNVNATNKKLENRSISIIQEITGVNTNIAEEVFFKADKNVSIATIMILHNINKDDALNLLQKHNGHLAHVLTSLNNN